MSITALAAAALATAAPATLPAPARTEQLVQPNDFPDGPLADGKSGAVVTSMLVDPEGRIVRCAVLAVAGDKRFEPVPCRVAKTRKIGPARSSAGLPIHDAHIQLFDFTVMEASDGSPIHRNRIPPDATLTVVALPGGAAQAEVVLALEIDMAGKIVACANAGVGPAPVAALVKAACSAASQLTYTHETDLAGKPIAYVTKRNIAFAVTTRR